MLKLVSCASPEPVLRILHRTRLRPTSHDPNPDFTMPSHDQLAHPCVANPSSACGCTVSQETLGPTAAVTSPYDFACMITVFRVQQPHVLLRVIARVRIAMPYKPDVSVPATRGSGQGFDSRCFCVHGRWQCWCVVEAAISGCYTHAIPTARHRIFSTLAY